MLQLFETSQENKYHVSRRKQSQEHGKRLHKMTYIDFKYAIKLSFMKKLHKSSSVRKVSPRIQGKWHLFGARAKI